MPKTNIDQSFKQLQTLVQELETGQLGLEESLAKFKSATELARSIKSKLKSLENELVELKNLDPQE